jgi:hypothetical protein
VTDYLERFPITKDQDSLVLYKAVGKNLSSLCSSTPIKYPKTGIITNEKLDPPSDGSCANGLHFSHLDWAINFGQHYSEFVLLKARIPIKHPETGEDNIIVAPDCDGKIRTAYAEILEVIEDWRSYQFSH